MAKLKSQIVTEINNLFVTQGNITAVETSTTLKDILDCVELNDKGDLTGIESRLTSVESVNGTQNSRLTVLELNSNNQGRFSFEATFQNPTVNGFFSFRGLTNHFVNVTLRIRIMESFSGTITFSSGQLAELKSMIDGTIDYASNYLLNFLVTITNEQVATQVDNYFRIANLNLHFLDDNTLIIRVQNYQNEPVGLNSGDEIYTSIALHSKYMDVTGKIMEDINKDLKDPLDVFVANPKDPKTGLKGTVVTGSKDAGNAINPPKKTDPILTLIKAKATPKTTPKGKNPPRKTNTSTVSGDKKSASPTKTTATAKTPTKKTTKAAPKPKVITKKPTKPIRKK
jgi:hypothetical protein